MTSLSKKVLLTAYVVIDIIYFYLTKKLESLSRTETYVLV